MILQMDGSSNGNLTVVMYRDTWSGVTKNVMAVALCIAINYVNSLILHTFHKNHVSLFRLIWFLIHSDQLMEMDFQFQLYKNIVTL